MIKHFVRKSIEMAGSVCDKVDTRSCPDTIFECKSNRTDGHKECTLDWSGVANKNCIWPNDSRCWPLSLIRSRSYLLEPNSHCFAIATLSASKCERIVGWPDWPSLETMKQSRETCTTMEKCRLLSTCSKLSTSYRNKLQSIKRITQIKGDLLTYCTLNKRLVSVR